jgi:AraC family transcriptional regulator
VSAQPLASSVLPAAQSRTSLPQCPKCRGNIFSEFRSRGLLFAEIVHPAEQDVPRHTHHTSFYHLTLAGKYEESTAHGRVCFAPFSSAFTHSETKHDGRIAPGGVHLFTLELGANWIQEFLQVHREPETVHDYAGGRLTCLGIQLYREYQEGKAASALTIGALVWELLAAAAALELGEMTTPAWWHRIIELLHFEFSRDLGISDLAQEAGVHPVHLARVFRRLTKQTPGEWLQRRRIRAACEKLLDPDRGIATIAAESGFADQSHMTRAFKRYLTMTPAQFRHTLRPSPRTSWHHQ